METGSALQDSVSSFAYIGCTLCTKSAEYQGRTFFLVGLARTSKIVQFEK